jgi:hypothetical protein
MFAFVTQHSYLKLLCMSIRTYFNNKITRSRQFMPTSFLPVMVVVLLVTTVLLLVATALLPVTTILLIGYDCIVTCYDCRVTSYDCDCPVIC